MNIRVHPLYGNYTVNEWITLYGHKKSDDIEILDKYKILLSDDKETPHRIKGQRNELNEKYGKVTISQEFKKPVGYTTLHLVLASAFPNIKPMETIDHINDDYTDNRVENLQWMSWSDNARKGQRTTVLKTNKNNGRNGKHIQMIKDNMRLNTFKSVENAAKYLIDNYCKNNPKQKTVASKITRNLSDANKLAYGFTFRVIQPEIIENEIWKRYDDKYSVSNKGRVMGCYNNIMTPNKNRNGSKYSSVYINYKRIYIHQIVWKTFNGEIGDGLEILHDDKASLLENGAYRNWLEDLKLGTRTENMIEFHSKNTFC